MLAGGGPVAARFMRQDFFEFLPQFKFALSAFTQNRQADYTDARSGCSADTPFYNHG
jgi:hypothetical protein